MSLPADSSRGSMHAELAGRTRGLMGLLVVLISFVPAQAQGAAVAPLRVAYPAPTASFLPLWAAHDAGFFKKNNLSVEVIQVGSSTRGMAALVANQIDVLAGGGTGGVVAQLQGYSDLAIFGTNVHTWVFSVYAAAPIREIAQLRGKKMAVTRFG